MTKFMIKWYTMEEEVKTEYIEIESDSESDAVRKVKAKYGANNYPAPLCSATKCN